mmetsp:Transcript_29598/g.66963  ORF Transcript_29598/g.66963 Transcript_29598/m.66963 type:complete len:267 (-) Transcript_29598:2114-2914(-)
MRAHLPLLCCFLAVRSAAAFLQVPAGMAACGRAQVACSKLALRPSAMASATSTSLRRAPLSTLRMGLFDAFAGPEINVVKLQVAVHCDTRGPSSLLGTIGRIADEADTETEEGLADLVSDVALALLRKESDWVSASLEKKVTRDEDEGESLFGQFSLQERAKIERETFNKVSGMDKSEARSSEGKLDDIGKATEAVITMILAIEGKELPSVKDMKSLRTCLTELGGSDMLGNNALLAAEIMWTPEEPWETITKEDLILEYPKLLPL